MSETENPGIKRRWARWRDRLRERPAADLAYRIGVGVIGLAVLGVGILAIPYPGPGWAIVFVGLAILATEFEWAQRLLKYVRKRYDAAMEWFKRQGLWVQILGAVFTAAIVIGTLWLFGVIDFAGELVGVEHKWMDSPIGIGA
ncbi:TIGR02611 family protein [Mycolicibacterium sp. BiH015]|uniref:TIGR02611 family protein n=1 Tax=Mycolicibacterium sp. BiH015 TaxID=3018808 RepID=UPI0022E0B56E|nr:TIGR02611 family protein [Mycolicibacterium sp. BiH015]MDA2891138.1 TIGR02611 family protein [Mycolicibacterium sp. BiH015]